MLSLSRRRRRRLYFPKHLKSNKLFDEHLLWYLMRWDCITKIISGLITLYWYIDVIKWKHLTAWLTLHAGNATVTGEFPAQRPVTRSFGVFFDLRPNKRLGKQSWGWWSETPSCSLWRHCNDLEYSHTMTMKRLRFHFVITKSWVWVK